MSYTRSVETFWKKTVFDLYNIEEELHRFERHVTQTGMEKMAIRVQSELGDLADTASMYVFGFDASNVMLLDHTYSSKLISNAMRDSAMYSSYTNAAIIKYTKNPHRVKRHSAHELIEEWAHDLTSKAYSKATTYFGLVYVCAEGKSMMEESWKGDKTFKDLFPILHAWNITQSGQCAHPPKKRSKQGFNT